MKLAAQFYTLREFTKTREGLYDALRRVAEMGYAGVQLSAVGCMNGENPEVSAADARAMLDEFGLVCCATHRPWEALRDRTEEELEFHRTLGCSYTAIGGVFGDASKGPGAFPRWIEQARPTIEALQAGGVRFGYHNHAHEFVFDSSIGKPAYEAFVDADWMQLEVDVYWVAHAGADPAALLSRVPGRIDMIHAKDREVVEDIGPVMAPVGEGLLNWDALLDACRTGGTEWLIVEQDECRRDPFDCLRSSYGFLTAKLGG